MEEQSKRRVERSATTVAVTSGKGSVGKTSLATNIAIGLSDSEYRVCLFDADIGLANVSILLNIQPKITFEDVLTGRAALDEAVIEGPKGLRILPGASGLERTSSTPFRNKALIEQLAALEASFDYLLVDTPAGIGTATRSFVHSCANTILTTTPEPTALTDTFTLMKTLLREGYRGRVCVAVNMLPDDQDGARLFERFQTAAHRHLNLDLCYLGHVPMDRAVTRAVLQQSPLLVYAPDSPAARHIEELTRRFTQQFPPLRGKLDFSSYWAEYPRQAPPRPVQPAAPSNNAEETCGTIVARPPEEMRELDQPESNELSRVADEAVCLLGAPEIDEGSARRLFARVERAFTARYQRRASDVNTLVYEILLQGQLSEAQHREILDALQASYQQRYGRLPDNRSSTASEQAPKELESEQLQELLDVLRPQLGKHPELARSVLRAWIAEAMRSEWWTTGASREIAEALGSAHEARFQEPLFNPSEKLRDSLQTLRDMLQTIRHAQERVLTELCSLLEEHAEVARRLEQPDESGLHGKDE